LKQWLLQAGATVLNLCRAEGHPAPLPPSPLPTDPGKAFASWRIFPSWHDFTHAFSRAFYPKRFPLLTAPTIHSG
jgi:hypothetical protein